MYYETGRGARSETQIGASPPCPVRGARIEWVKPLTPLFVGALGLPLDARGYVHPRSEEEVAALVRHARAEGLAVRVRGAAHSVPAAIHSDARLSDAGRPAIEIVLDRCTAVSFDEARRRVTVQAGCRFGRDPRDPTRRSTIESGLCFQLEQRGLALPHLGGVSHATIGGFLATGSAGGSATRGLWDSIVALRLIDGTGAVRELRRDDDDPDRFRAAGVSLGLLGVIIAVTFECIPRFDILGSESITTVERCAFDLFGEGPGSLDAFLREAPYARVLWWPQRGVDKLAVWQARPMDPGDYHDDTGPRGALRRRPYRAFDPILGTTLPVQAAAGAALAVLGGARAFVEQAAGPALGGAALRIAEQAGIPRLKTALINAFVPEDRRGPQRFWDSWWQGLPMDDEIDERLLPTTFTEIWIPLSATPEAMRRLRALFARDPAAAGNFVIELYAAGPSPFWLSPGYGQTSLRLNIFWLMRNPEDPRDTYFPRLWSALEDLGARLHWGKLMPHDAAATATRLAQRYPRWDDFPRLRAELDPDGVFLTAYWRAQLGIAAERPASAEPRGASREAPCLAPLPRARPLDEPAARSLKWPLLFTFQRADAALLGRAEQTIEAHGHVPAPPEEVCRVFWFEPMAEWLVAYVGIEWLTEFGALDDAVTDMTFSFMTIRLRVIKADLPRRWVTQVLACSVPLGSRMVEEVTLTPTPDGGTDVFWRIAYDLPPPVSEKLSPDLIRLLTIRSSTTGSEDGSRGEAIF